MLFAKRNKNIFTVILFRALFANLTGMYIVHTCRHPRAHESLQKRGARAATFTKWLFVLGQFSSLLPDDLLALLSLVYAFQQWSSCELFIRARAKINGVSLGWLLIFVDYLYTS